MAVVIKLGNLLAKSREKDEAVRQYLDQHHSEKWNAFEDGELHHSNELNNKNLGGQQPRSSMDEEEDNKGFEMSMEKIMAKFSDFNSSRSSNSEEFEDEDEDDEENEVKNLDDDHEESHEEVEVSSPEKHLNEDEHDSQTLVDVEPADNKPLAQDFTDSQYWKQGISIESIDDLLADYQ